MAYVCFFFWKRIRMLFKSARKNVCFVGNLLPPPHIYQMASPLLLSQSVLSVSFRCVFTASRAPVISHDDYVAHSVLCCFLFFSLWQSVKLWVAYGGMFPCQYVVDLLLRAPPVDKWVRGGRFFSETNIFAPTVENGCIALQNHW